MVNKKKKPSAFLTEVELEFMTVLWTVPEANVRGVMARLSPDRELAYTSASTILRILEQKKFVASRKEGKSHLYRAVLGKDEYQSRTLRDLSRKLFDDTPAALVARLVDDYDLTSADMQEIREMLDKRAK